MTRPPHGALIIAVNARWHRPTTLAIPARYAYEQQIPLHLIACVVHEQDQDRPEELRDLFLRSAAVITAEHPDLELTIDLMLQPTAHHLAEVARECNAPALGLGPALIAQPECVTLIEDVTDIAPCKVAIYPNRSVHATVGPVVVALAPHLPEAAHHEALEVARRFAEMRDHDICVVAPTPPSRPAGLFRRKPTLSEPPALHWARAHWPDLRFHLHQSPPGSTLVGTALTLAPSMLITSLPDAAEEVPHQLLPQSPTNEPVTSAITNEELTRITQFGYLAAAGMPVILLPNAALAAHG